MRIPNHTLIAAAAGLSVSLVAGVAPASAQCTITGPTSVCPGTEFELCGPTFDNSQALWQGPDGILYMTDCIVVSDPGLYTLKFLDLTTHVWSAPCSLVVASGVGGPPEITGPASTCSGTPANWCGPTGSFEYSWTGPNGFAATTACVTLDAAGDYQLRVRPLPDGCWSDSTVRTLSVTNCNTPKTSCPRPAWWWAREAARGSGSVGQVAGCVDDHDSYFTWSTALDGFRRTLLAPHRSLKMRAARQVAAVWANVCAGNFGVTTEQGTAVTLDLSAALTLPGVSGTVGDWLANADAQLASLDARPEHTFSVRSAYRRLITAGWFINHGIGIGSSCTHPGPNSSLVSVTAQDAASIDPADPEPLSVELLDDSDGPLVLGDLTPNPFSTMTRLAFAVSSPASAEVSIGVYDLNGRLIRELVRGSYAPGQYEARWDGLASDGSTVKSGVYFILGRIGGQQVQTRVSFVR